MAKNQRRSFCCVASATKLSSVMKWRRVDAILAENMRRCLEDAAAAIDPSPCKKKKLPGDHGEGETRSF